MATLDFPRLRPLSFSRLDHQGQSFVAVQDPHGALPNPVLIPMDGFRYVIRHFDGQTPLLEVQSRIFEETGQRVTTEELQGLVQELDRAMVLDGPTFAAFYQAYRQEVVRPAAHAGRAYPGTELALRAHLKNHFKHPRGAGLPGTDGDGTAARPRRSLRAVISPHIDYHRGGPVYSWAYRALAEHCDADTFVILGVAHQGSRHRFALTLKDFETPLGRVRTDRGYVRRIAELAGEHLFDDELTHRTEHSIEFQAVFLQYLLGERRPFTIVPILVGSFHDLMERGIDPIRDDEVSGFIQALRAAEAECGRKVTYIGGVDLGHVGTQFGDPDLVSDATLERLRNFDAAMLSCAAAGDPSGWFGTAAAVGNTWRVCGLAATYTLLHAIGPVSGRILKYDQAIDDERTCCVSFASLAFEASAAPVIDGVTVEGFPHVP